MLSCVTVAVSFPAASTFLQAESRRVSVVDLGVYGAAELNDRGEAALNENQGRAFAGIWQAGDVRELGGASEGYLAGALGINDQGQVVGYGPGVSCFACNVSIHAMVWHPDGSRVMLPHLPASVKRGAADGSEAHAINNKGDVAGWSFSGVPGRGGWQQAVFWRDGRVQELPSAGEGLSSAAYDINHQGDVAGWADFRLSPDGPRATHAALWAGSLMDLGSLAGPAGSSIAYKVNNHRVVVGTSDAAGGGKRAFRWSDGKMVDLGTLAGDTDSEGFAINSRGDIAGKSYKRACPTCVPSAVVWVDGVAIDLNTRIPQDSGWHLTEAIDIDDQGRVLGRGTHNGEPRFFLLEM